MDAMPTLAIGVDPEWRARMRRLLASRQEVKWYSEKSFARRSSVRSRLR